MIEQKDSIQVRHVACMVPSVIVNIQHTRALATFFCVILVVLIPFYSEILGS
jgi:hypothetical protein